MEETLKMIKEITTEAAEKHNIEIDKIILFGSRARRDYSKESDWDILIVTKEKLDWIRRKEFLAHALRKLAKLRIRAEFLIIDKDTLEEYKKWEGFVYYYATTEGIVV